MGQQPEFWITCTDDAGCSAQSMVTSYSPINCDTAWSNLQTNMSAVCASRCSNLSMTWCDSAQKGNCIFGMMSTWEVDGYCCCS